MLLVLALSALDQPVDVGGKTIFAVLVGFVTAEALYIVKLHASKAAEIKAIYEERIEELKGQTELVETLLDELDKARKERDQKPRGQH